MDIVIRAFASRKPFQKIWLELDQVGVLREQLVSLWSHDLYGVCKIYSMRASLDLERDHLRPGRLVFPVKEPVFRVPVTMNGDQSHSSLRADLHLFDRVFTLSRERLRGVKPSLVLNLYDRFMIQVPEDVRHPLPLLSVPLQHIVPEGPPVSSDYLM